MEESRETLLGKSGTERGVIMSKWLGEIMAATSYEDALRKVLKVYNSGFSDGSDSRAAWK